MQWGGKGREWRAGRVSERNSMRLCRKAYQPTLLEALHASNQAEPDTQMSLLA